MFTNVLTTARVGFNVLKFAAIKHAPELLVGSGLISTAVGTVLACKTSRRIDLLVKPENEEIEKCKESVGKPLSDGTTYSEEDLEKDVKSFNVEKAVKVIKAYMPAVLLIVAGFGCVISGHFLSMRRIKALGEALACTTAAFADYRNRVKDIYGEEKEEAIYKGYYEVSDKDGNKVADCDDGYASPYTFLWGEGNETFESINSMNAAFLRQRENYWTERLGRVGHVWLNDVLEDLGLEKCAMGRVCGWVKDKGDNCVSFGKLCDDFIERAANHEYDNEAALNVMFDFNCEGNILDYAY